MKSFTIYGYANHRYFVPANNPYGHYTWFPTKRARDAAVYDLETRAGQQGLSDPRFRRVKRRIRTDLQRDWFERLRSSGILRSNGIDGPQNSASHSWEGDEP
jgi:hypothetical protein